MLDTLYIISSELPPNHFIDHMKHVKKIHDCHSGCVEIKGWYKNLFIRISDGQTHIGGSLCKYFHGNNVNTLRYSEICQALASLRSDLGLTLRDARVYRIDLGANMVMEAPVKLYFRLMGNAARFKRLELTGETLQYHTKQRVMQLYDKVAEVRSKKSISEKQLMPKHLLRYELQYRKGISNQLKREVYVSDLEEKCFLDQLVDNWESAYHSILKIRELDTLLKWDWKAILSMAIAELVQSRGGLVAIEKEIQWARQSGQVTSKTAWRIIKRIRDACQSESITSPCNKIEELDEKIMQVASRFRAGESLNINLPT